MSLQHELIRFTCPECEMRQIGSIEFIDDHPFIQCGYSKCRHIITGHEIEGSTRQTIKSPLEIKKHRK